MDTVISILIVEDDKQTCDELTRCIAQYDDMKVVATCNNSKTALEKTRYYLPNVVILDLELHYGGGNGLMFLDNLLDTPLSLTPFILVTTNTMSAVTLEQARAMGADFTLTKYEDGYSAQYVVDNIRMLRNAILRKNKMQHSMQLSPASEEHLIMSRIQRELDLIGIKTKAKGYNYLTEAIKLVIDDRECRVSHILSEKYKKSSTSIERAMQNAIKQAWTTNDVDALYNNYTAKIRDDKGYPTMMEFIYYYANKIKMDTTAENLRY